jgi:hypothetical protein
MAHDAATIFRSLFGSGSLTCTRPLPLIDNFKVVIFDRFGTVAGFEVVVLIWIRERKTERRWDAPPSAFTTPTKMQAGMARPASKALRPRRLRRPQCQAHQQSGMAWTAFHMLEEHDGHRAACNHCDHIAAVPHRRRRPGLNEETVSQQTAMMAMRFVSVNVICRQVVLPPNC